MPILISLRSGASKGIVSISSRSRISITSSGPPNNSDALLRIAVRLGVGLVVRNSSHMRCGGGIAELNWRDRDRDASSRLTRSGNFDTFVRLDRARRAGCDILGWLSVQRRQLQ